MNKKSVHKVLYGIAIVLFVLATITLYAGYDKVTNYYNSDYEILNVNAYVGGDAYNYIINGNYATGYFVLTVGFMITGTLLIGTGLILKTMNENETEVKGIVVEEDIQQLSEKLPTI